MKKNSRKLFGKDENDEFSHLPEGVCPNCWGHQEYGNIIREKFFDQQVSVNNHDPTAKYAFIQEYIVANLSGIRLKNDIHRLVCPNCRIIYEKDSEGHLKKVR